MLMMQRQANASADWGIANGSTMAEASMELRCATLRKQLGLAARKRVERISLACAEERMKAIYAELPQANSSCQRNFEEKRS